MSTSDRILQLKLIADVSSINSKMQGVSQDVGRVSSAMNTLKGWAMPAMLGLGTSISQNVVANLSDAVARAGDLRRELDNLESLGLGGMSELE